MAAPTGHQAAAVPSISDSHSIGGITFFNAVGIPVHSGSDLAHVADYAVASTSDTGARSAAVSFALVDNSLADPRMWAVSPTTTVTSFPVSELGASVSSPTVPAATINPGEGDLAAFLLQSKVSSAAVVEVRLLDGDATGVDPSRYWSATIQVDPTAGTWTAIAEAPQGRQRALATTPSAVAVSAITIQQSFGEKPTLTASVVTADLSHPAGKASLLDGLTEVASAKYDQSTGTATATPNLGDQAQQHRLRFVFTPDNTALYLPASSPELLVSSTKGHLHDRDTRIFVVVNPPADLRSYGSTSLSAWIKPSSVRGSVRFHDSLNGDLGSVSIKDGVAKLLTNSLGPGDHTVTAEFVPAKDGCAKSSTASSPTFTLTGAAQQGDAQTATVNVHNGQLTITTPYTPDHPFKLGNLVLNDAGSKLIATAHFGSAADAIAHGITINDARGTSQPWTASVAATNFLNGSSAINAQNLGFVGIHRMADNSAGAQTGPVVTHDLPASTQLRAAGAAGSDGLAGLPKAFATVLHGGGTVYLYGDLVLSAPTTTAAGTYSATLTFTVG